MSPSPSTSPARRRFLAALGAAGVGSAGVAAGYAGAVTVPYLSPVWERWRTDTNESGVVGVAAAVADGRLLFTRGDRLAALDPDAGDRLWSRHVSDRLSFGVAVGDDAVYAGDDKLAAFGFDGAKRWCTPATDYGRSAPAVTDDRLYVSSAVTGGSRRLGEGAVVAYDADGDHLWTRGAGEGNQPIPSPVVRDGAVCVVGDESAFALVERGW